MLKEKINLSLIMIIMLFTMAATHTKGIRSYVDIKNITMSEVNYSIDESLTSCPSISPSNFSLRVWPHKIRIEYDDASTYPVVSWESNDPATTTLDSDDGNFAHYHYNGYDFLNIKITVTDGSTNCVSTHVVNF